MCFAGHIGTATSVLSGHPEVGATAPACHPIVSFSIPTGEKKTSKDRATSNQNEAFS